ncbi:Gametolysin peptidase M11 [Micrococcales bacterium KH10]|nr:Gametolysin peptidase M11 [Micrococcales bacterium KH10]
MFTRPHRIDASSLHRVRLGTSRIVLAMSLIAGTATMSAQSSAALGDTPVAASAHHIDTGTPNSNDAPLGAVSSSVTTTPLTTTDNSPATTGDLLVLDTPEDQEIEGLDVRTDLGLLPSDLAPHIGDDTPEGIGFTEAPAAPGTYKSAERVISRLKAPRAKNRLRTLVIRAHWNGNRKDKTSTKRLRKLTSNADKVLRSATRGRYGINATYTPWIKISRTSCNDVRLIGQRATRAAAARNRAHNADRFNRVVIYFPHSSSCASWAGRGEMPGKYVWLNGAKQATVLAHELGHNFGLGHANVVQCNKSRTLTRRGHGCKSHEYGDLGDLMGAGPYSGLTQAAMQHQASWLTKGRMRNAQKRKTTVKLRPRSSNKGIRAVRVRGKGATYWVEYRTRSGLDKVLSKDLTGVTVSLAPPRRGHASNALDMQPQNNNSAIALPLGASWTSPEGIRFQVKKQTKKRATVVVQRRAKKARKPAAPKQVTVQPGDLSAFVTVAKGNDRGAPIQRWRVRAVPVAGGHTISGTVTATAALSRTVMVQQLTNGTAYRVQVRARNEKGWSSWSAPISVTPAPVTPVVTVSSPVTGQSYSQTIPLRLSASTRDTTPAVITSLYAYLDLPWSSSPVYVGRQGFTKKLDLSYDLDTGILPDGTYPMRFIAQDSQGRIGAVTRNVTIVGKSPRITQATAAISGNTLTVNYTMTPQLNQVQGVLIGVRNTANGSVVASSPWLYPTAGVEAQWTQSATSWAPGTYTVEVIALDRNYWPREQIPLEGQPSWGYHRVTRPVTK